MWTDNDGVTHLEPQDLDKRYCLVSDGLGGFLLGLADDYSVSTMPEFTKEKTKEKEVNSKWQEKPRLARWQDVRRRK